MFSTRDRTPTSFFAGPEDEYATKDVYDINTSETINNTSIPIIDAKSGFPDELAGRASDMVSKLPMTGLSDIKLNVTTAADVKAAATSKAGGVLATVKSFTSNLAASATPVFKALGGVSGIKALASADSSTVLSRLGSGGLLNGIPGLSGGSSLSSLSSVLNSKNIPDGMKALISSPIPSQLGAYSTINGVVSKLSVGNLGQASQVGSMINNILPGSPQVTIVDKDLTARLMTSFAVGGMSSGVSTAFSSVLPLAGGDNAIISKVAQSAASYASGTGNIQGLKDVVTSVGSKQLASSGKSLMTSLASNYKTDATTSVSASRQAKDDFNDVTNIFGKIDSTWARADKLVIDPITNLQVTEYPVVDLSSVQCGTADFKNTMKIGASTTTDPDLKFFNMLDMFPVAPPEDRLKASFPLTYTQVSTKTTTSVTELPSQDDSWKRNVKIDGEYGDWRDQVVIN